MGSMRPVSVTTVVRRQVDLSRTRKVRPEWPLTWLMTSRGFARRSVVRNVTQAAGASTADLLRIATVSSGFPAMVTEGVASASTALGAIGLVAAFARLAPAVSAPSSNNAPTAL